MGAASRVRIRSAISSPSAWVASIIRTANSSPPRRAAVSTPRTIASSRSPTVVSTSSPAACPSRSLTSLNSSMSQNSTTTGSASSRRAASACPSRSANSSRLARPVRPSWNAWWISCCSITCRSVTSRTVSTKPATCGWESMFVRTPSIVSVRPSACVIWKWTSSSSSWRSPATSWMTRGTSSSSTYASTPCPVMSSGWWPSTRSDAGLTKVAVRSASRISVRSALFLTSTVSRSSLATRASCSVSRCCSSRWRRITRRNQQNQPTVATTSKIT